MLIVIHHVVVVCARLVEAASLPPSPAVVASPTFSRPISPLVSHEALLNPLTWMFKAAISTHTHPTPSPHIASSPRCLYSSPLYPCYLYSTAEIPPEQNPAPKTSSTRVSRKTQWGGRRGSSQCKRGCNHRIGVRIGGPIAYCGPVRSSSSSSSSSISSSSSSASPPHPVGGQGQWDGRSGAWWWQGGEG